MDTNAALFQERCGNGRIYASGEGNEDFLSLSPHRGGRGKNRTSDPGFISLPRTKIWTNGYGWNRTIGLRLIRTAFYH